MNHMAYVTVAYVVTVIGAGGLALLSWRAMRRAEALAEALGKKS